MKMTCILKEKELWVISMRSDPDPNFLDGRSRNLLEGRIRVTSTRIRNPVEDNGMLSSVHKNNNQGKHLAKQS